MRSIAHEGSLPFNLRSNVIQTKNPVSSHIVTPFAPRHARAKHRSDLNRLIVRSGSSDALVVESTIKSAHIAQSNWTRFAESVSGEWDGVTATFDRDGEPQELPSYYVPEAYRDWGVKIHDWQSQCSALATDGAFTYSLRRLMPTVGCEADAIAFTEETTQQQGTVYNPTNMAYDDIGNYSLSTVDDISSIDVKKVQYEHCFVLEKGQRVRVIHTVKRMGSDQSWKLMEIEVHREKYDCKYTGRRELAGCGGGMDLFAVSTPVDIQQEIMKRRGDNASVVWKEQCGVRFTQENGGTGEHIENSQQLQPSPITAATVISDAIDSNAYQVVGLPLKVFSIACMDGNDAELIAGVVLNNDDNLSMRVSRQNVAGGVVVERELLHLSSV